MAERPAVSPGDWIRLKGTPGLDAVVCNVWPPELVADAGDLEVVYLDERDRAISVDVTWDGTGWEFAHDFVDGGYADKHDRFREYVRTLRRGRYR